MRQANCSLSVRNLGPIRSADLSFGDLTVIVGPQATGKSVLLQTLKLIVDRPNVQETFADNNLVFNGDSAAFLDAYYGKGMSSIWREGSELRWCGKPLSLPELSKPTKAQARHERFFFIPAQRVVSLRGGSTQNFGQFEFGDPYVLRAFSDRVHTLVQTEFGARGELFPAPNRLNETLRRPIQKHLFGQGRLEIDATDFTKRLVLKLPDHQKGLPYLAWSAGQREFTPMLLGIYWLCPAGKTTRRHSDGKKGTEIEWVVIEEPEMGLHPQAIATVLLLALELLKRGYKVVISTHSPVVLDMVWALRLFRENAGTEEDVRGLFELPASPHAKALATTAMKKRTAVYFFRRNGEVRDISTLDPAAPDREEAEWGGLTGFASRAGELISRAVNRREFAESRKRRRQAAASAP